MDSYDQARAYLYALKNRGSKFGIERMARLVEELEHPQRKFPVIHVAGTNGKGSVCAMLEALYRDNGYKTGLYTSPHLVHLGERVQVDREPLNEEQICRALSHLRPTAERVAAADAELHPTFFEFITAMAFQRFAESSVDIALIETGLGGRLDATNVVDPELSIITSISYDHMEQLGSTLARIAEEKAGIIKPGRPVLMGCLPDEAAEVVRRVAAERGCLCHSVREHYEANSLPKTNLVGNFQRWNAALALLAVELLQDKFPVAQTGALKRIEWAGRWQRLEVAGRQVILDATHNPEGAEALRGNLERLVAENGCRPIIVAGTLGEDRARGLMRAVAPFAAELHLVEPRQDRSTPREFLESCLPADCSFPVRQSEVSHLFPAPGECTLGQPGDSIVVTGSIYLIGEVLELLQSGTRADDTLQDKI